MITGPMTKARLDHVIGLLGSGIHSTEVGADLIQRQTTNWHIQTEVVRKVQGFLTPRVSVQDNTITIVFTKFIPQEITSSIIGTLKVTYSDHSEIFPILKELKIL